MTTSKSVDADQYYSAAAKRALYGPTGKRPTGPTGKRGGARPGAGRKPTGPKTVSTNFTLSPETFAELQAIPRGARSKFVDAAIRAKLAKSL